MPKAKIKNKISHIVIIILSFSIAEFSFSDQVYLSNGDKLTGNLINLEQDKMFWYSDIIGEINFPVKDIQGLQTIEDVLVTFSNEDKVNGRFNVNRSGDITLETERFGSINIPSFDEILSVRTISGSNTQNNAVTIKQSPSLYNTLAEDEVILASGARLLGEFIELQEQNLLINTKFAGELSLKKSDISQIYTKKPVTVIFQGGEYITGKISSLKSNQLELHSKKLDKTKPFILSEVTSIVTGDPREKVLKERRVRFSGRMDVGLSRSSGNSDNENYSAKGEFRARTPENRFTVRGEKILEKSEGDKTEDKTFGSMKYDHFFGEKWFLFGSASFEEDEIELLNLRTALSAGLGYQFFERDDLFLSVEAGPAYVNEDFDEDDDNDSMSMRWGIDYEYDILSWASIFHFQDGLFGLETSEDIVIRTRSGVRFPLGNGFSATAAASIDWDKSPAEGADTTDKEYIFSLGYEF